MGMSCFEMPFVMGHSLLAIQGRVVVAGGFPCGQQPGRRGFAQARRVGVLRRQEQLARGLGEHEADLGVERVDAVLALRVEG
jgi:hypothetical protein